MQRQARQQCWRSICWLIVALCRFSQPAVETARPSLRIWRPASVCTGSPTATYRVSRTETGRVSTHQARHPKVGAVGVSSRIRVMGAKLHVARRLQHRINHRNRLGREKTRPSLRLAVRNSVPFRIRSIRGSEPVPSAAWPVVRLPAGSPDASIRHIRRATGARVQCPA